MTAARVVRCRHLAVVVIVTVALVGCGGGSSSSAASDKDRARTVTLTDADLPQLTREADGEGDDDELPSADRDPSSYEALFRECLGNNALLTDLGLGPRGASSAFRNDDGSVSVSSLVVFAEKVEDAAAAFTAVSEPTFADCLEDALHAIYEDFGAAPDVSVSGLPVGAGSDDGAGYRVTLDYAVELAPVNVTADFVFVRVGRGVAALLLTDLARPFDDGERDRLTGILTDRFRKVT